MTPSQIGALKALGVIILMSFLSWASQSANITPLIGTTAAGIVTMLVASFESYLKQQSGNNTALFGSVSVK